MTMMRLAKTVVEPTAKNGFIFTILGTKWGFLWLWLLIINFWPMAWTSFWLS